jgi:hypothetical protein
LFFFLLFCLSLSFRYILIVQPRMSWHLLYSQAGLLSLSPNCWQYGDCRHVLPCPRTPSSLILFIILEVQLQNELPSKQHSFIIHSINFCWSLLYVRDYYMTKQTLISET